MKLLLFEPRGHDHAFNIVASISWPYLASIPFFFSCQNLDRRFVFVSVHYLSGNTQRSLADGDDWHLRFCLTCFLFLLSTKAFRLVHLREGLLASCCFVATNSLFKCLALVMAFHRITIQYCTIRCTIDCEAISERACSLSRSNYKLLFCWIRFDTGDGDLRLVGSPNFLPTRGSRILAAT